MKSMKQNKSLTTLVWIGIGYHHAVVDRKGRQLVEMLFSKGFILIFPFKDLKRMEAIMVRSLIPSFFPDCLLIWLISCKKRLLLMGEVLW